MFFLTLYGIIFYNLELSSRDRKFSRKGTELIQQSNISKKKESFLQIREKPYLIFDLTISLVEISRTFPISPFVSLSKISPNLFLSACAYVSIN